MGDQEERPVTTEIPDAEQALADWDAAGHEAHLAWRSGCGMTAALYAAYAAAWVRYRDTVDALPPDQFKQHAPF